MPEQELEVSIDEALIRLSRGAQLLDVRSEAERGIGFPSQSVILDTESLPHNLESLSLEKDTALIVLCSVGCRSLLVAEQMRQLGFENAYSLAGGYKAWVDAGLEVKKSFASGFSDRYQRQMILPEVGVQGQKKLRDSKVLLIGAGGLGSPIAFYLAGAGIGHLTIMDGDYVDLSNLHRQILHKDSNVGKAKVDSASETLHAYNPEIRLRALCRRLNDQDEELVLEHDLVIDGTDSMESRYLINALCLATATPWVYGAVSRFAGQVGAFSGKKGEPCYQCLYPLMEDKEQPAGCSVEGVVGAMPGLIGMYQTLEAIKLIVDLQPTLSSKLLMIDALHYQNRMVSMHADKHCPACQ